MAAQGYVPKATAFERQKKSRGVELGGPCRRLRGAACGAHCAGAVLPFKDKGGPEAAFERLLRLRIDPHASNRGMRVGSSPPAWGSNLC